MSFRSAKPGRKVVASVIALSLIVAGGILAFHFSFARGAASSVPSYYLPDVNLSISPAIKQKGDKLWITINDITHEGGLVNWEQEQQPLLAKLMAKARLSWRAVRVDGDQCNARLFWRAASSRQLDSGGFDSGGFPRPYQRSMVVDNFIPLTVADHASFHCFQIKSGKHFIYVRSPKPANMPLQSDIRDVNVATDNPRFDYSFDASEDTFRLVLAAFNGRVGQPADMPQHYTLFTTRVDSAAECSSDKIASKRPRINLLYPVQSLPAELIRVNLDDLARHSFLRQSGELICFQITLLNGQRKSEHYVSRRVPWVETANLPEKLTLDGALEIFERQLTDEGRTILAGVSLELHENGCEGDSYETYPISGCWTPWKNKIFINDDAFLFYNVYSERDYHRQQLQELKSVLKSLAHETLHAVEDKTSASNGYEGLRLTIFACHEQSMDPIDESLEGLDRVAEVVNRWLPTGEKLNPATEACLYDHPFWGDVAKALKQTYENHPASTLPNIPLLWSEGYGQDIEIFSVLWYTEFYAELPTYAIDLPEILENHYGQYFKNRQRFAKTLNGLRHYFEY